jgi:hypothetical protein
MVASAGEYECYATVTKLAAHERIVTSFSRPIEEHDGCGRFISLIGSILFMVLHEHERFRDTIERRRWKHRKMA